LTGERCLPHQPACLHFSLSLGGRASSCRH
jgi:hypothetical protein